MGVRILHDEDEMASFSFIIKLGLVQSTQNFEDKSTQPPLTANLSTQIIKTAIQNL